MEYIKKHILLAVILLTGISYAQLAPESLATDSDTTFKYGVLDNGLTYYIKSNKKPLNQAFFYIAHDVGAMQEEDHQNGLAHFLEHLAFNGSTNFPKKGIKELLERNGVPFGDNINAYTSKTETVYNIDGVPTENPQLLDSVVLVLHDWSRSLSLETEEIEAERAVIKEEWRTRNSAQSRILKQTEPVFFNGSKWGERSVIGDMDIVENFDPKVLKDFYRKWYRPDLQSVIIVGDFDASVMEKRVKRILSKIPKIEHPEAKEKYAIPDNEELLYIVATDKEARVVPTIQLTKRSPLLFPKEKRNSIASIKNELVNFLLNVSLTNRFQELAKEDDCPYYFMNFSNGGIGDTKFSTLTISPKEHLIKEAFKTALTEIKNIDTFGVLRSEVDRAKKVALSVYENSLNLKDEISSREYVGKYQSHFLHNAPVLDMEKYYDFVKDYFNELTLSDINEHLKNNLEGLNQYPYQNTFLSITGIDEAGVQYPTKEIMVQLMQDVQNAEVASSYIEEKIPATLMNDDIVPGKIVHKKNVLKGLKVVEYTLSNGIKFIMYPNDKDSGDIEFAAISPGGFSSIRTDDLPEAYITAYIAGKSGIGNYDDTTVKKILSGKAVTLNPSITEYYDKLYGNSSTKDLETLLQMIHLQFKSPRFDKKVFKKTIESEKIKLKSDKNSPDYIFEREYSKLYRSFNERRPELNEGHLDKMSFKKIQEVYKDRFLDPNNFTFFFAGKLEEKMLPLFEKYLGSLTPDHRSENWVYDNKEFIIFPKKNMKSHFNVEMKTEKSKVAVNFHGAKEYNQTMLNNYTLYIVSSLLKDRYFNSLREEVGGTYGASVFADIQDKPVSNFSIRVGFDADPDKSKKLLKIVKKEFKDLVKNGAKEKDFANIKTGLLKNIDNKTDHNSFLLYGIQKYYETGIDEISVVDEKRLLNGLSLEKFNILVKKLFKDYKRVEILMKPKK